MCGKCSKSISHGATIHRAACTLLGHMVAQAAQSCPDWAHLPLGTQPSPEQSGWDCGAQGAAGAETGHLPSLGEQEGQLCGGNVEWLPGGEGLAG